MKYTSPEAYLQSKNIAYIAVSDGKELIIQCPSCKNEKNKCYVSTTGQGFYCFHCGIGGSFKTLVGTFGGNYQDVEFDIIEGEQEPDLPPIDPAIIEANHQALIRGSKCEDVRKYLHDRGINDATISKFKIGWAGRTLTIPVIQSGDCFNFRWRSDPTSPSANKTTYNIAGRGRKRLFNEDVLKTKPQLIVISEGEWDCMLLDSKGYATVTSTGGAASFDETWIPYFKDIPNIYICLDNDRNGVGQKAAIKLQKRFADHEINTTIITLPEPQGSAKNVDATDYFTKLGKTKENFDELVSHSSGTKTPGHTHSIDELVDLVESYIPNTGRALKLALAVATSGIRVNRAMLWMIFVGAPSGGKTDVTKLLKKSNIIVKVDSLTPNAFVSGERETEKRKNQDMLPSLASKCLVIKDLTVLFSQNEEAAKKIIGDLVGIYDKEFTKQAPGRGNISYESEFSILACITPATLNKHHNYLNMIGARFLQYTVPPLTQEEKQKSFDAIFDEKRDRLKQEKQAQVSVSNYLDYLNTLDISKIKNPSKAVQEYLKVASLFVCKARGIVIIQSGSYTNNEGKTITFYEPLDTQIEYPWRAVQQLLTLAKYLALVSQKDEIGEEELEIIKDIVLSSMPADRAQAIRALEETPEITAKDLSEQVSRSWKTAGRLLEELTWLEVVSKDKGTGQAPNNYKLKEEFEGFVTLSVSAYMSSPEFLSSNYRGTETSVHPHKQLTPTPTTLEEALDGLAF